MAVTAERGTRDVTSAGCSKSTRACSGCLHALGACLHALGACLHALGACIRRTWIDSCAWTRCRVGKTGITSTPRQKAFHTRTHSVGVPSLAHKHTLRSSPPVVRQRQVARCERHVRVARFVHVDASEGFKRRCGCRRSAAAAGGSNSGRATQVGTAARATALFPIAKANAREHTQHATAAAAAAAASTAAFDATAAAATAAAACECSGCEATAHCSCDATAACRYTPRQVSLQVDHVQVVTAGHGDDSVPTAAQRRHVVDHAGKRDRPRVGNQTPAAAAAAAACRAAVHGWSTGRAGNGAAATAATPAPAARRRRCGRTTAAAATT
eukprot:356754-Chlamydomonas_euryale.AAC.2